MRKIKETTLSTSFETSIAALAQSFTAFPWDNRDAYAFWLSQTYHLVVHTTRFLGLCAGKFGVHQAEQHHRALEHIAEERGHDLLALGDLKALGFKINDFPELPQTSALYHGQYYWIEMAGPMAHYGYSLCLEGLASRIGLDVVKQLESLYGKPSVRFLRLHSIEDKSHFDSGVIQLDNVTPVDRDNIISNLNQSCAMYGMMLAEIAQRIGQQHQTRARSA